MVFDKSKLMVFPRHVLLGHNVVDQLGQLCRDLELGPKAMIVCDPRTKEIAGEKAAQRLGAAGFQSSFVLIEAATMKWVDHVKAEAKKAGADFLIGAGGGSVIDVAKLSAFDLHIPYISLPTSAAHDGIASARASIKETAGNVSKEAKPPEAIVADTHLILKAPWRMIAAGCGDVLANLVAVKDWELAHHLKGEEYSSFAAALSRTAAELVLENAADIRPGLEESVWIVVKSLITSGVAMSVAGNSRPASGSEHLFSHMLDRIAPGKALHGEQCGVGAIMMMRLHGGNWQQIRNALKSAGAPTNAKELGITPELILQALAGAHRIRLDRYTILGESGLSKEAALQLARETGVI